MNVVSLYSLVQCYIQQLSKLPQRPPSAKSPFFRSLSGTSLTSPSNEKSIVFYEHYILIPNFLSSNAAHALSIVSYTATPSTS